MLIVAYHAIAEHVSPVCTSRAQFADDLSRLQDAGFGFVSLNDCADWLHGSHAMPDRSVAITFDDGYRSVMEHALPLLAAAGAPVTVFIIAGRLGHDNAWQGQWTSVPRMPLVDASQVREMAASGIEIGVHSWSHRVLRGLDDPLLRQEVDDATDLLQQIAGMQMHHFSYPYGIKGERELRAVQGRFRTGVNAAPYIVDRRADPCDLPRVDPHDLRLSVRLGLTSARTLKPYLALRRLVSRAAPFHTGALVTTRSWQAFGATLLFVTLTVFHTWPLAMTPASRVIRNGDVMVNMWALNNLMHQLMNAPSRLFDGTIFAPFPNSLAAVDHHLSNSVIAAGLHLISDDPIFVTNVMFLLTFVLSGLLLYLLVSRLTGSSAGALVAGCAFAFSHYRFGHAVHLHVLSTHWLVLALLAVHGFLRRPTWARWTALLLSGLFVAFSSWHMALVGGVTISLVIFWTMLADGGPLLRRTALLLAAACVIGLALIPLVRGYRQVHEGWGRPGGETTGARVSMSTKVGDLFTLPAGAGSAPFFPGLVVIALAIPALRRLTRAPADQSHGRRRAVRALIWTGCLPAVIITLAATVGEPGGWLVDLLRPLAPFVLLSVALVALGLWLARRAPRASPQHTVALTYTAVAVSGVMLALGPRVFMGDVDLGAGVYQTALLPMLSASRAPARFGLLLALGLSALAGISVADYLRSRPAPRRTAWLVMMCLVALNYDVWRAPLPLASVPPLADVHRWLAEQPEDGAVIEYPTDHWTIHATLQHGRRLVGGLAYVWPPELQGLYAAPALSRPQLEVLWEYFHPRFVVIRGDRYTPADRAVIMQHIAAQPNALKLRARFGQDYIYELIDRGIGQVLRPINPEHLHPGMNSLDIQADYQFASDDPGYPIGTTGTRLNADVVVRADRDQSRVTINGRALAVDKGYLLVVLAANTGNIIETGAFDSSTTPDASARLAAFVRHVPAGSPVIVASEYDVSRQLTQEAVEALRELGLREDLRNRLTWLAAIGVKGAPIGSALEATNRRTAVVSLGELKTPAVRLTGLSLY